MSEENIVKIIIEIITILVSAITAAIVGTVSFKRNLRQMKTEFLANHRKELIGKQISAYEALWEKLVMTSLYGNGNDRIALKSGDKYYVNVNLAKEFNKDITDVFFSFAGLYFSKTLRSDLFKLRNYIEHEFIRPYTSENKELISISKPQFSKYRDLVTKLITTMRAELNVENLHVVQDGPFPHE